MKVLSYKYITPGSDGLVTVLDRSGYMTPQYIDQMYEYINGVQLTGKVAFLYAAGAVLPASEARNTVDKGIYREKAKDSGPCVKEIAAYGMHRWIGMLNEPSKVAYASINGNTCASSMFSLYEAEQLLEKGFDEVIIVAEEKTAYNTIRIFDELNIDLKIGEGCAIIHLGKGDGISECKWAYEYTRNPFGVTASGYTLVDNSQCNLVNPHGTGTPNNESAEDVVFGDREQIRFKEVYGHTQGVSGLLEVCLVLDTNYKGNVLCVASGLGNFYGSCSIQM